ncbi:MAG TPA: beta-ketoacyl synthase N-terminal-like domain-containing protein, partial [Anaeromyxobacter sp.]|nr:beta-ketoacyl synthase N-terminal-like domain-containing protein [Anaeromyxobacter sp.]
MPDSRSLEDFWRHLRDRHHLVRRVPQARWSQETISADALVGWGAYLDDVDCFDSEFFGITPLEAEHMDPQQRLFLQVGWSVIEDAGYSAAALAGTKTGVFVGVGGQDYTVLCAQDGAEPEAHTPIGMAHCVVANRISYLLDLHGPSEAIDTACSSALVAVHHAIRAIQDGECDLAIAGGVNLVLSPALNAAFGKAGMLSPDGRCKTFDAAANGYVRGEGAAAVLLKPLARAIADGDEIRATILGSAVNHGGRAHSLTAPNPQAQADVIVAAVRDAGVDPETIGYIEAHGTGTALGDPIEVNGLKKAFRELLPGQRSAGAHAFCGLGSVKTNVGHLETAAGIAGLVKVLYSLKHRFLPASLHLEKLNPHIDLGGTPFHVLTQGKEWGAVRGEAGDLPRRAGVSSFGIGGVNAHVVVEEHRREGAATAAGAMAPGPRLFVLSARSAERLEESARRLAAFLREDPGARAALADVAYTLQVGRVAMAERVAIVAAGAEELVEALDAFAGGKSRPETFRGSAAAGATLQVDGEEGREFLAALLRKGRLEQVAKLWVAGADVDWTRVDGARDRRRVALPTYPFARERHWLPAGPAQVRARRAAPANAPEGVPAAPPPRTTETPPADPARDGVGDAPVAPEAAAEAYLRALFARTLKLPATTVTEDKPFEQYGIDSLAVTKLTYEMEKDLGPLSKTLFFEYRNLSELAGFFAREFPGRLLAPGAAAPEDAAAASPPDEAAADAAPVTYAGSAAVAVDRARVVASRGPLDIAIVGLAGRYPEAPTLERFWNNLRDGNDSIREIPAERWDHRHHFDPRRGVPGKAYGRWGGFIEGADCFDPLIFGITPREAEFMDPQERLFLEAAWEAIEDAGYTRASLRPSRVGVFAGVMYSEYQLFRASVGGREVSPGSFHASIANRVSYHFNFRGESIALDTMCSSSLTAIHLACQSLRLGHSDVALAGGVNLSLHPNKYAFLSLGRFLSPEGACRSFGEGGEGYVPGEGVGAVLLKPLEAALADGDHVYAVIKGTAVNHGGKTSGYTVPNPNAQGELIARALDAAGVDARTIEYVEAHGTGTSLGDPIEIAGLTKAFRRHTADRQFCAIGSVKSNIGHLEAAAGIAGLTKLLLQLEHGELVPSLHSERLNPNIDFDASPFVVQRTRSPWPRRDDAVPRRACISGFGAGGANAHLVIEDAPRVEGGPPAAPGKRVFVVSAATEAILRDYAGRLTRWVRDQGAPASEAEELAALDRIAFTLQVGREPMQERLAVVAASLPELAASLDAFVRSGADGRRAFRGSVAPRPSPELPEPGRRTSEAGAPRPAAEELARAWVDGKSVAWPWSASADKPRRISLPTYPFERKRHWIPTGGGGGIAAPAASPSATEVRREVTLTGASFHLEDHRVGGRAVVPGAAYLELARAVAAPDLGNVRALEDVRFIEPMWVDAQRTAFVRVAAAGGRASFEILSEDDPANPSVHACGRMALVSAAAEASPPALDLDAIMRRCTGSLDHREVYETFERLGIAYGPSFQTIERLHHRPGEALARLELPPAWFEDASTSGFSPALLDGAFQSVLGAIRWERPALAVPASIKRLCVLGEIPRTCYSHVTASREGERAFDVALCDDSGRVFLQLEQFEVAPVEWAGAADAGVSDETRCYGRRWVARPAQPREGSAGERLLLAFVPDGSAAGERWRAALARTGAERAYRSIVRAVPAAGFELAGDVARLDPRDPQHHVRLVRELAERGFDAVDVAHLWAFEPDASAPAHLVEGIDRGFGSMLHTSQALMAHARQVPVRIAFGYPDAGERTRPEHRAMSAFARTLSAENPRFTCAALGAPVEGTGEADPDRA